MSCGLKPDAPSSPLPDPAQSLNLGGEKRLHTSDSACRVCGASSAHLHDHRMRTQDSRYSSPDLDTSDRGPSQVVGERHATALRSKTIAGAINTLYDALEVFEKTHRKKLQFLVTQP